MVRQDVIEGYVSIGRAKEEYGVVLDAKTLEIRWEETKKMRAQSAK
jgi:N-methylhydantoinase B/oxoprolinase/acetone carboxylase alpha subunit